MEERRAVKMTDIEQMILLGDKVLDEVMMSLCMYDGNGVPLPSEKYGEQLDKDSLDGTDKLIWNVLREEYECFDNVLALTADDLGKKLAPLKKRVLGMFRNGVLEEWFRYTFYADDSVPDDWLFTLFLMRVRDRKIVMAQKKLSENKFKDKQK